MHGGVRLRHFSQDFGQGQDHPRLTGYRLRVISSQDD
jgi:hypothetical protein